jgi:hypothetical protein
VARLSVPVGPRVERGVFAIGVLLRLYLAVVNREANDDHLSVIRIIAFQHHLPRLREAWEGFQPKLYHVSVAVLWHLSPWQSSTAQILIAQLVGCVASIATLFIIRHSLIRRGVTPPIRLLAFALVALNPALIGLSAQATNDSFVIMFSTLALDRAIEFFRSGARRDYILMTAAVVLAALSKGNALVVFIAIVVTLVHAIVQSQRIPALSRRQVVALTAAFVGVFVVFTVTLGSYRSNWQDTGSPFSVNGDPAPMPHFIERTYVYRPGTTSVADTYFTFRFVDMLEHPFITNSRDVYPLHRTSLWSQLYGRAHVIQFAQHPPSWRNTSPLVLNISRLILVLALLPTALLLAGILRASAQVTTAVARRVSSRDTLDKELLVLTALGFIAFIILYTLRYRDFSTMKAEFLFPGLLAYVFIFADEILLAVATYARRPRVQQLGAYLIATLLTFYVVDVLILAVQLT